MRAQVGAEELGPMVVASLIAGIVMEILKEEEKKG